MKTYTPCMIMPMNTIFKLGKEPDERKWRGKNVLTYFSSLCCDTGEPVVAKVGIVHSLVAGAWMEDGWREITDPVQPPAFVLTWCKLRSILYAEEIGGSSCEW